MSRRVVALVLAPGAVQGAAIAIPFRFRREPRQIVAERGISPRPATDAVFDEAGLEAISAFPLDPPLRVELPVVFDFR